MNTRINLLNNQRKHILFERYILFLVLFFAWVSDCCLTATQQLFSYIMATTSGVSRVWQVGHVPWAPRTKIGFYIYYLLIISPGIHVYVYYMVFAKLLQENYLKNLF
jgi:hypothetical protein